MMKRKSQQDGFFYNSMEFFHQFKGKIIAADEIEFTDFTDLKVAIIGINQFTATYLDQITQQAKSVKVFQMKPHFILPQTEKAIHRLLSHPLIFKNRRLFNNRVKSLLAIRYLDMQVQDLWLKHQLTPNIVSTHKQFFKSDYYYAALQRQNCQLITWPIVKVTELAIQSMESTEHFVDVIITTFSEQK